MSRIILVSSDTAIKEQYKHQIEEMHKFDVYSPLKKLIYGYSYLGTDEKLHIILPQDSLLKCPDSARALVQHETGHYIHNHHEEGLNKILDLKSELEADSFVDHRYLGGLLILLDGMLSIMNTSNSLDRKIIKITELRKEAIIERIEKIK